MARLPSPPLQRAVLTKQKILRGLDLLRRLLDALNGFDTSSMQENFPPEISALEQRVRDTLEKIFGPGSAQYHLFIKAADIRWSPGAVVLGQTTPLSRYVEGTERHRRESVALIREAIRSLEEDLEDFDEPAAAHGGATRASAILSKDVFVVHGHDHHARELVARFLRDIGLNPIILNERANEGRTIIEKFEQSSEVSFAVVLLTPDDIGGANGNQALNPRARQNVVLELGYFVGKLGRKNVCALKRGDVEVPSDYHGVVYLPFEDGGDWPMKLAQELRAAGHVVDWNDVMNGGAS